MRVGVGIPVQTKRVLQVELGDYETSEFVLFCKSPLEIMMSFLDLAMTGSIAWVAVQYF